jgi:hypothetical protein
MKFPSVSLRSGHYYILDAKNRPVQVFDRSEWSRWMAENNLIFRRTLLDDFGVTVTTRFRGLLEREPGGTSLFVTRVAGMEGLDSKSYGANALDEALEQHERMVQKLLQMLTGR